MRDEEHTTRPLLRIWLCGEMQMEWIDPLTGQTAPFTEREVRGPDATQAVALLKLLLCQPGRQAHRDWIMEQFWPEHVRSVATHRFHNITSAFRKLLSAPNGIPLLPPISGRKDSQSVYALPAYPQVWVDSDAILWNVEQAVRMERYGDDSFPFWQRAYDLLKRGPFLVTEPYAEWARGRRERLEGCSRQCVHALWRLYVERQAEAGKAEAIFVLRTYWQEHKTDEDSLRPLMELLGEQERYQEAEEYYQQLVHALTDLESGADKHAKGPDSRTQDIREYLRTKQVQRQSEVRQSRDTVEVHKTSNESLAGASFLALQQQLSQEATTLRLSQDTNTGYLLSRRQALLAITALTLPLLTSSKKNLSYLAIEELLSSVTAGIHACWELSNEFDIIAVYSVVSTYLSPLVTLVKQSSSHRKAAAHLAAQAFLLKAIIGRHVADLSTAEAACKEAILYSKIAEDLVLHLATLRHLAMIYYYAKRHKEELALYQQHMQPFLSLSAISPFLQSFVYAGWAGTQAINGLPQDAQTSLAHAREKFFLQSGTEELPAYIDYDYSQLFLSEGLTYYDLGHYKESMKSFLEVDGLSPKVPVAERGRLEFLNCQALTLVRLPNRDNDMQQCIDYWMAGVQGAIRLKSRQRYDEACNIYTIMEFVWPHEKKIKELREIMTLF